MEKLRIFIDMDGVLCDFDKAKRNHPDFEKKGFRPDLTLDFSKFEAMPGALEAVKKLVDLKDGDSKLYYQYKVKGKLKKYFENHGFEFQIDKFDYFLSCYQDN